MISDNIWWYLMILDGLGPRNQTKNMGIGAMAQTRNDACRYVKRHTNTIITCTIYIYIINYNYIYNVYIIYIINYNYIYNVYIIYLHYRYIYYTYTTLYCTLLLSYCYLSWFFLGRLKTKGKQIEPVRGFTPTIILFQQHGCVRPWATLSRWYTPDSKTRVFEAINRLTSGVSRPSRGERHLRPGSKTSEGSTGWYSQHWKSQSLAPVSENCVFLGSTNYSTYLCEKIAFYHSFGILCQ